MKKIFIVALCVAGMMSSCSDIDDNIANDAKSSILLTQQEYASIVPDSQLEMTQDEIVDMVSKFSTTGNSTRAIAANPTIVKKFSLSSYSNGKQIPLYEVSLNEGDDAGYAIVSGDERVPGVIAYVEHGSLNDTLTNKGAAMMLKEAQRSLISKVKAVDVVIDSLRASAKAKISAKIGTSSFTFEGVKDRIEVQKGITRSVATSDPQGTLLKQVTPLITTKWNQCAPYNNLMDETTASEMQNWPYYGKNAVGCTAVAIAQIVAFYECLSTVNGVSLNWSALKASSQISNYGNESLKTQISNLFYHVAHGIQTIWNNGVGGAKISNASSYLSGLGITFDSGRKWAGYSMDAGRIIESLDKLYPVIITGAYEAGTRSSSVGGRHCWILDGYQIRRRTTTTRIIVKQNDTYIHANFGWSGSEDGYYMVDRNTTNLDFETSFNGHYNQDLKLYPNVRKK